MLLGIDDTRVSHYQHYEHRRHVGSCQQFTYEYTDIAYHLPAKCVLSVVALVKEFALFFGSQAVVATKSYLVQYAVNLFLALLLAALILPVFLLVGWGRLIVVGSETGCKRLIEE